MGHATERATERATESRGGRLSRPAWNLRMVLASVYALIALFALGISSMEVIGAAAPSAATPVAHVVPRSFVLSTHVLPSPGSCNSGPTCCPPSGSGVDYYGNLLYGYDSQLGEIEPRHVVGIRV